MLGSITFGVAVNRKDVLEKNLLASPLFQRPHSHQIYIQEHFPSAAKAYNDVLDKSPNEIVIFLHQDMILPETWLADLEKALADLETRDSHWGVLGVYGETLHDGGRGYIYSTGRGFLGAPFDHPAEVSALDEIVLVLRKSSGVRFDDGLPGFHMYGADICMAAAKRGMKGYAISAFCIHNTSFNLVLPQEFYDCYRHVQRTRREFLPIQTTCVKITKFGGPMYVRKLRECWLKYFRRIRVGAIREANVGQLLAVVSVQQQSSAKAGTTAG